MVGPQRIRKKRGDIFLRFQYDSNGFKTVGLPEVANLAKMYCVEILPYSQISVQKLSFVKWFQVRKPGPGFVASVLGVAGMLFLGCRWWGSFTELFLQDYL